MVNQDKLFSAMGLAGVFAALRDFFAVIPALVLGEVARPMHTDGLNLKHEVLRLCEQPHDFQFSYELDQPIKAKILDIVRKVYGGEDDSSRFVNGVLGRIARAEEAGEGEAPEGEAPEEKAAEGEAE